MKVTVICFGPLRDYLPDAAEDGRASIELPSGADVEALVVALQMPYRRVYALLVNGQQAAGSTALHDGDQITLMPPFSGGAGRSRSQ